MMQKFFAEFIATDVQLYLMRFPGQENSFDTREHSESIQTYIACRSSILRSTEAIERFALMDRPENFKDRYLIVWGVMQAIIIQQDAIRSLYKFFGFPFPNNFHVWMELRDLRNATGGHPTKNSFKSSSLIVEFDAEDWGVMMLFRGESVRIRPFILERLGTYELELLEAFAPIGDEIQNRIERKGQTD